MLDSPLEKVGQAVYDFLYGDPTDLSGFVNPMTAPIGAVTGYLTKKGVPDVARRVAQTTVIRDKIAGALEGNALRDQAMKLLDRFPRVTAHLTEVNDPVDLVTQQFRNAQLAQNTIQSGGTTPLKRVYGTYTPKPAEKFGSLVLDAADPEVTDTLAHELTHTAQGIGIGPRAGGLYDLLGLRGNARQGVVDAMEASAYPTGVRQTMLTAGVPRKTVQAVIPAQTPKLPGLVRDEVVRQLRRDAVLKRIKETGQ